MIAHLSPEAAYQRVTGQQKLAAEPEASVWVSANAGSGKTKVLIDRVARLLLAGFEPDSILCITYTKAAASEMQQRLFKRLGNWSVMADDELAKDLTDLQDSPTGRYDTDALKKARALFAKALETPGGLRIETLHAFAGRVLKRFPLEAGIPPGFTELDDVEGGRIWDAAARKAFLDLFNSDAHRDGLRTVIANVGGLGLEAIRKLVQGNAVAIRDFLSRHPTPEAVHAAITKALRAPAMEEVDFIRRAMVDDFPRNDIRSAIDLYLDDGSSTNKDRAEVLEKVLGEPDPTRALDLYKSFFLTGDGKPRKALYTKSLNGTLVDRLFNPGTGRELNRMKDVFSSLSAIGLRDRTAALMAVARPLLAEHEAGKRMIAGLDFDDLILETRNLLQKPGIAEWVLFKLDGGISHVLLDEAQDTSPDQWTIINQLVSEFFAGASAADKIRTLFVVGDEKQSIYSFQGADTAKFQSERQRFAARQSDSPEASVLHLPEIEMSFRTTPEILEFVDTVFNGLSDTGHPTFTTEIPSAADRIRHHPFRYDQSGKVEFWPIEAPVKADTGIPWDAPLDMEREVSAPRQLSQKIAQWIKARLASEDGLWTEGRPARARNAEPGDILILVRSRGPVFHAIIRELKAEGLPVAGADRINLLETLVVQDLLNLIRFALCPDDDLTLAEILKGPFVGLLDDDAYLFPIANGRHETTLWQSLQDSELGEHREATDFLQEVLAHRQAPAFEFLDHFLQKQYASSGLTGWQLINRRFGLPSRDPVEALMGIAGGLEDQQSASLQTFLAAVEAMNTDIKRELSGPSGEIRVMTVHGAKGLEAPIVILPDTTGLPRDRLTGGLSFTDDAVPIWLESGKNECEAAAAIRAREQARLRAESLRLLYVALTRARDQLVICGAWRGGLNGRGYETGSWYEVCEQALAQFGDRGMVSAEGASWSFGQLPKVRQEMESVDTAADIPPLPDWSFKPVREIRSRSEQRAPSQLLPGDTPVLPPFGTNHVDRFRRGRLIHALLEILPDIPVVDREERADRYLFNSLTDDEFELFEDVKRTAFSVLTDPAMKEVFGPGGRAEAPIVGRGPNLPPGLVINGRIDRMRITRDTVWVIDFKTDRPPPTSVETVAPPYLAQMGAYFDVLSHTYPDKTVKCALLWTHTPHFMVLPESAMLDALTKARARV